MNYYQSVADFFAANPQASWRDYYAAVRASGDDPFATPEAQASMREDAQRVIAEATEGRE